jgi:type III restriction enzyme
VSIASENVDDLFEATGRKLNEGLHKAWWREKVKDTPEDRERAKLELFALCADPEVMRAIENAAQETVQMWLKAYRSEIAALGEDSRARYEEVRNLAASPELSPLVYPTALKASTAEDTWKKHVYVDEDGLYPAKFNEAEKAVVRREIASTSVVGWLRNIDRKAWSLCVPYEVGGEARAMYPDFLVVRKEKSGLVVDLIEPHSISLSDSPAKANGLAKFAAKHADKFGRIELILINDKAAKSFDLADEVVRKKFLSVVTIDHLRDLHAAA